MYARCVKIIRAPVADTEGGAGGHGPLQTHATAQQMSDFKAKMHQIRFRPRLQIGFLNILDMILSRASGGSAPGAWTPLGAYAPT